jgi:NTE family protein
MRSVALTRRPCARSTSIRRHTPLQNIPAYELTRDTMIFQVDLFTSRGAPPRDIQDVMSRRKNFAYASRTPYNKEVDRLLRKWERQSYEVPLKVPLDQLSNDDPALRDRLAKIPDITILHLIYRQQAYAGASKDHKFSGTSKREHWSGGLNDTRRTLPSRLAPNAAARIGRNPARRA